MKVLVTGAEGYIGSVLTPYLMDRGYSVTGLDTGYYTAGLLYHVSKSRPPLLVRDIRDVDAEDLRGFDAVVHLAELSNDALGEHDRKTTMDVNWRGSCSIADAARKAGVRRFVYASSCSVYGVGADDIKDETSAPDPRTAYAECKVLCEQHLTSITDPANFVTTCLRNATAFGASPRMRFDIVLNNLAGLARTTGRIAMSSDGTPWRPLVHILDICQAIELTLAAPADRVAGQIFNVGADDQTYRVRDIANIVGEVFTGCEVTFGDPSPDNRSYQVSFAKIREHLPEFRCDWSAQAGARQLHRLFQAIDLSAADFSRPPYTRLKELRRLLDLGRLDGRFRWTSLDIDSPMAEPAAMLAASAG